MGLFASLQNKAHPLTPSRRWWREKTVIVFMLKAAELSIRQSVEAPGGEAIRGETHAGLFPLALSAECVEVLRDQSLLQTPPDG